MVVIMGITGMKFMCKYLNLSEILQFTTKVIKYTTIVVYFILFIQYAAIGFYGHESIWLPLPECFHNALANFNCAQLYGLLALVVLSVGMLFAGILQGCHYLFCQEIETECSEL